MNLTRKKIGEYRKKNVRKRIGQFLERLFSEETVAHDCGSTGLVCNCCYQINPAANHARGTPGIKSCWVGCPAWKKCCCLLAGDLGLRLWLFRATTLIVTATWKTQSSGLRMMLFIVTVLLLIFIYLCLCCHIAGLKSSSKYIQLVYLKKFKCFTSPFFPCCLINKYLGFSVTFTLDCIFASSSQANMILFQPLVCLSIV